MTYRSPMERFRAWLDGDTDALERMMVESQLREAQVPEAPESEEDFEAEVEQREAEWVEHMAERRVLPAARAVYNVICMLICLVLIVLLLFTVTRLPGFGRVDHPINNEVSARYIEQGLQETGAVNIVTGMILDYRAFDTLGESTVLFTAVMVVLLLLRMDAGSARYSRMAEEMQRLPHSDRFYEPKRDSILQYSARIMVPMVFMMGIYVVLNGHLSPGGGFSGGAIIGAGLVLYVNAFGFDAIRRFFTYKTYQRLVVTALLTYAASKCYSFYTGANGLPSGIPLGTPGAILSSGLILVLNICVGVIVACTVYVLYAMFRRGEV